MKKFGKLSEIGISSVSWRKRIFLTFDLDWACDEVLSFTFEKLISNRIPCTIFSTHRSKYTEFLSDNDLFEVGPHPNFNFLCQGDFRYGKNVSEVLNYYESFSNTKVIRSHDSFVKTEYLKEIEARGYTHESNFLIRQNPTNSMIAAPFRAWGAKLIRVPITWEDDEWFYDEPSRSSVDCELSYDLRVFNFHPIHIFLNTSHPMQYEKIKSNQHDVDLLRRNINKSEYGVRDAFFELIEGH